MGRDVIQPGRKVRRFWRKRLLSPSSRHSKFLPWRFSKNVNVQADFRHHYPEDSNFHILSQRILKHHTALVVSAHISYALSYTLKACVLSRNSQSFRHHLILFCGWQLRERKACNNSQNSAVLETEHRRDWWAEFKSGKKTSLFFLALACIIVAEFPKILVRLSVTASAIVADSHWDKVLPQCSIT